MKNLMWKLLRRNVSVMQMAGFALANLVGLTIVILAVQFYNDVAPIFNDDEGFLGKDYLVVTREVRSTDMFTGGGGFAEADIADLKSQPWVRDAAGFETSHFNVTASIGAGGGHSLRTDFFFEAIPDKFVDVEVDEWKFDPQRPVIPVILSRDYLSLYNFGFAATQGMPKVSESMVGMIPVMFAITGNGQSVNIPGRIVGFSTRLNTIVVPDEFLRWANERYGDSHASDVMRLIVEVSKPGDVQIERYMADHHYQVAGDKDASNKATFFLTIVVTIVIAVGALISALAFFVLMLSIYLLLQKNSKRLQDLLMIGYSPAQVSAPYIKMVVIMNTLILVLAVTLMLVARGCYLPMISAFGAEEAGVVVACLTAVLIMAAITTANVLAIRRNVLALWHG